MAYATSPDLLTRSGNYGVTKEYMDAPVVLKRFIDCSTDNLTSGSFYKLFAVPANFCVMEAYVVCHTAEGAAETVDIVDDDSATTTFVTNANVNSAGTITATNARKMFTAAGFIVARPDADLGTCKFEVIVHGVLIKTTD